MHTMQCKGLLLIRSRKLRCMHMDLGNSAKGLLWHHKHLGIVSVGANEMQHRQCELPPVWRHPLHIFPACHEYSFNILARSLHE